MLNNTPGEQKLRNIVIEAVAIEKEFVCDALPCALVGMNADMMRDYIEYVADHLLSQLEYNTANPFDWMELISLQGKTNFFEKRVGEYQKSGVTGGSGSMTTFTLEEDF
jgi:ribonucleotide reductase beta subunit family protein with ferritin-like domain